MSFELPRLTSQLVAFISGLLLFFVFFGEVPVALDLSSSDIFQIAIFGLFIGTIGMFCMGHLKARAEESRIKAWNRLSKESELKQNIKPWEYRTTAQYKTELKINNAMRGVLLAPIVSFFIMLVIFWNKPDLFLAIIVLFVYCCCMALICWNFIDKELVGMSIFDWFKKRSKKQVGGFLVGCGIILMLIGLGINFGAISLPAGWDTLNAWVQVGMFSGALGITILASRLK